MPRWPLVLVPLLVAGCTGASGGNGGTTTTTLAVPVTTVATTAQPTTTSATSFAVPAEIDLPYVQRVLRTIYHLDGEATRHAYTKKLPDAELYDRLEAIFGGARLDSAKRTLGESAAQQFSTYADPPGDPIVRALDILQATPSCMIILADLDYGPIFKATRPSEPQAIIQMARAQVLPFNPTGWGIFGAGTPVDSKSELRSCPG